MAFGDNEPEFDPNKKLEEMESRIKKHINGFLADQINALATHIDDVKKQVVSHERLMQTLITSIENFAISISMNNADIIRLKGIIEGTFKTKWEDIPPLDKPKKRAKKEKKVSNDINN